MSKNRQALVSFVNSNLKNHIKVENSIIEILNNILTYEDDNIKRISEDSDEKGFLVISPGGGNNDRHLALKVDENTFWTISATEDGEKLEIGILKDGEQEPRPVITFGKDAALALGKPLQLSEGLEFAENRIKGIRTSGFKGFTEGQLAPNGKWQILNHKIPAKTFGKYKVQAWVIRETPKNCVHIESTFVFFPDGSVKQHNKQFFKNTIERVKKRLKTASTDQENDDNLPTLSTDSGTNSVKLFSNPFKWFRYNKETDNITTDLKLYVGPYRKLEKSGRIQIPQNKGKDKYEADDMVMAIRSTTNVTEEKCIYYTIERLWEGRDWIDT